MQLNVGIPRALLYYKYFPMWQGFLDKLGAKITVSGTTNQHLVAGGASRVVTDTCLPVKVFIGHVLSLAGNCDRILIPVLRSTRRKVYNCSRFLGLPDVARAVVPEAPPILEIEFDLNRGKGYLYRQIHALGKHFTNNPLKIRDAARYAWTVFNEYRDLAVRRQITRVEAIDVLQGKAAVAPIRDSSKNMTIGLVGHPYVLYDDQVSHRLITRLRKAGIRGLTPEMAPARSAAGESLAGEIGLANSYWESEEDVLDAADHYIRTGVDGIIGMMAFSCGPDSMMMHLAQRRAQDAGIPFMCLTLEEHTAEAGIVTRLEAFLDMLRRRQKRQPICV